MAMVLRLAEGVGFEPTVRSTKSRHYTGEVAPMRRNDAESVKVDLSSGSASHILAASLAP